MKNGYGSLRLWLWTFTPLFCTTCTFLLRLSTTEFGEEYGRWAADHLYQLVVVAGYGAYFVAPISFFVWRVLRNAERETIRADVLSLQRTIFVFGEVFFLACLLGTILLVRAR